MKHRTPYPFLTFLLAAFLAWSSQAAEPEASTLTRVGQAVPAFKITTLDGSVLDTDKLKGKVVIVNFFATWCGPCMAEMPRLEKEVWQRFKDKGLVVVALGREHSNDELLKFRKEKSFTFQIAADPKREVYGKFATQFIPRTYLIKKDGTIGFQSMGYTVEEFKQLVAAVEKELPR